LDFLQNTGKVLLIMGFFANHPAGLAKIRFVLPPTGGNFDLKYGLILMTNDK
jgi:hypothetical protein